MKILATLLIALLAPIMAVAANCTADSTLKERMVLIEKFSRGKGSGVLFNDRLVLTNNHVVEDIEKIWVWVPQLQRSVAADVLHASASPDIAILRLRESVPNTPRLKLAPALLPETDLRMLGFPFGEKSKLSIADARFQYFARMENMTEPDIMFSVLDDGWSFAGDSGGGVFTCDGKLAGIHFANRALDGKQNHVYAVNARALERILKSLNITVAARW